MTIDRVIFEGKRAIGVAGHRGGAAVEYRTGGEVILAAGGLKSPLLLERSGIGDAQRLQTLGIPLIHHSPGVGNFAAPARSDSSRASARIFWSTGY